MHTYRSFFYKYSYACLGNLALIDMILKFLGIFVCLRIKDGLSKAWTRSVAQKWRSFLGVGWQQFCLSGLLLIALVGGISKSLDSDICFSETFESGRNVRTGKGPSIMCILWVILPLKSWIILHSFCSCHCL